MSSQPSPARTRPRYGRLIGAQAAVGALVSAVAAAVAGPAVALAATLGALTGTLPQAWLAWRVFGPGGATAREGIQDPRVMLRALFRGESIKLAATAVAVIGIFRFWPAVPPIPLIVGLMAVQAAHWFAPLLLEG